MNSLSARRMSLDIAPANVKVKLTFHSFMSRVKKKLSAWSVLLSFEFLSLGFFTSGTFSWSTYFPPLVEAASHTHARAVNLDSPAKTDNLFALKRYSEQTSRTGVFLTARENAGVSLRRSRVFVRLLAPKVSRYISKSVLNI